MDNCVEPCTISDSTLFRLVRYGTSTVNSTETTAHNPKVDGIDCRFEKVYSSSIINLLGAIVDDKGITDELLNILTSNLSYFLHSSYRTVSVATGYNGTMADIDCEATGYHKNVYARNQG